MWCRGRDKHLSKASEASQEDSPSNGGHECPAVSAELVQATPRTCSRGRNSRTPWTYVENDVSAPVGPLKGRPVDVSSYFQTKIEIIW